MTATPLELVLLSLILSVTIFLLLWIVQIRTRNAGIVDAGWAMTIGAPWGWLAFASRLIIVHLVLNVTGIPPTEEQALRSRGDDYRDYQRTTSAFVPWFPKV